MSFGEDATSAPVSSEVDERQKHRKDGFTGSHAEERSKCNPCGNLLLYKRTFYVTLTTLSKHGETCCDTLTRTEVEQGQNSPLTEYH